MVNSWFLIVKIDLGHFVKKLKNIHDGKLLMKNRMRKHFPKIFWKKSKIVKNTKTSSNYFLKFKNQFGHFVTEIKKVYPLGVKP